MSSIRVRARKDGSEYVSVLWREQGKQHSISFDLPEDALAFKKRVDQFGGSEALRLEGLASTHEQTLTEWLTAYVAGRSGIQPATRNRYERYIANDIAPVIGELPIGAVSEASISRWVDTLKGAPKTVANKHGFLYSGLAAAVRAGKLKSNPCEYTSLPKQHRAEMVFLSPAEFARIRDEMKEPWRSLAVWLVSTGTRFSEATALQVGDIDKVAGTCRISRAWKYSHDAEHRIGAPKSQKGTRTINLPSQALAAVNLDRPRKELLFPPPNGGERITHGMFRDPWVNAIDAAGLAVRPRPHDLRHSCASWMIAAGVPLPVISAHLGHESITVTVGVYGHLARESFAQAANAIDAALSK